MGRNPYYIRKRRYLVVLLAMGVQTEANQPSINHQSTAKIKR